jgi:hypothetical protein
MYLPLPSLHELEPALAVNLGAMTHVQDPCTPRDYFDDCPFTQELGRRLGPAFATYRMALKGEVGLVLDGPAFQRRHVDRLRARLLRDSCDELASWSVLHLEVISPAMGVLLQAGEALDEWCYSKKTCCGRRRIRDHQGDARLVIGAQYVEAVSEHWRRNFGGLTLAG